MDNRCVNRVMTGASLGAALGGSIGALYGTYEAFQYKIPGVHKIRWIGQTTLGSAAVCLLMQKQIFLACSWALDPCYTVDAVKDTDGYVPTADAAALQDQL